MTRRRLTGALAAAGIGYAASIAGALAQNDGTAAEQEACTPDVFRLCEAYIPNEGPIVACLKSNRVRLSPACSQVFFPVNAQAGTSKASVRKHKRKHHRSS